MPYEFLRAHEMVPLHWETRQRTLLVGFPSRLDYVAMSAIEAVLHCRVKPCILREDLFQVAMLQFESGPRHTAVFPSHLNIADRARIVRNYVQETGAEEVRCGTSSRYFWARLSGTGCTDLLFAVPGYTGAVAEI